MRVFIPQSIALRNKFIFRYSSRDLYTVSLQEWTESDVFFLRDADAD